MRLELEAAVPENAVAGGVVVYLPEMRRAIAGILCFFAFTSATGCKKEPEKKVDSHPSTVPTETTASAQPSATPPKTKEKPATEWVVFEPEPTKFSLSFPGKPAESTTPTPSPAGEMTHHDAQLSYRECYYAIGWMDFPAGAVLDPKKALDGARDGAVKSGGGRIRTEKSVKLNGKHPGRDIVFDVNSPIKATGYLHIYIVGKRFYQTLVVEPALHPDQPTIDKFQESFKVK